MSAHAIKVGPLEAFALRGSVPRDCVFRAARFALTGVFWFIFRVVVVFTFCAAVAFTFTFCCFITSAPLPEQNFLTGTANKQRACQTERRIESLV